MASENTKMSGLQLIPDDFSLGYYDEDVFSLKSKERGLIYFKEGYIHKIKVNKFSENGKVHIAARCYKSMKKGEDPHTLHIELDIENKTILDSYCSCTAGSGGKCSHIVGLVKSIQQLKLLGLTDAPSEQSCTSLPQTWHIPRGNKIKPVPLSQVVVVKAKENRKRAPIMPKTLPSTRLPTLSEAQKSLLRTVEGAPISHIDLRETPNIMSDWGEIMLGSVLGYQAKDTEVELNTNNATSCGDTAFPKASRVRLPPWHHCLVPEFIIADPKALEESTRDQYLNPDWMKYRANRITASKMHIVIKRKKAPTSSMLKSLFNTKSFSNTATEYGLSREKMAKEKYVMLKSATNSHIHDCGLIINNACPFLAATPDAKVCEGNECGILEIKCPYVARDMTIEEACANVDRFLLCKENNEFKLRRSHDYYVQIQGQLLVSGAPWCDLAVYTTKDFCVERIVPDIPFITDMLLKLSFFHRFHGVPYLKLQ